MTTKWNNYLSSLLNQGGVVATDHPIVERMMDNHRMMYLKNHRQRLLELAEDPPYLLYVFVWLALSSLFCAYLWVRILSPYDLSQAILMATQAAQFGLSTVLIFWKLDAFYGWRAKRAMRQLHVLRKRWGM